MTTYEVFKGYDSPFLYQINDILGARYTSAKMDTITRMTLTYVPSDGATAEPVDSDNVLHSDVFNWATYKTTGKAIINLGMLTVTEGQDQFAEIVVYDTDWPNGRVVGQIDLKITEKATGANIPTSFTEPVTFTDSGTVTTGSLGGSVYMNAATAKSLNLPSMGASENGKRITFFIIGAGDLSLVCADSDNIVSSTQTTLTGTGELASITLEYIHALTTWGVVSVGAGSWS